MKGLNGFEAVSNLKQPGCRVKRFFPVSKPVISRAFGFWNKNASYFFYGDSWQLSSFTALSFALKFSYKKKSTYFFHRAHA